MHNIFTIRKLYSKLEKEKKQVDRLMWFVSMVGPFSTIPQAMTIFVSHEARGVSLLAWALNIAINAVSLSYALIHRIKPVIVSSSLWLILDLVIVIGILRYK